jgi:hypothetical protein
VPKTKEEGDRIMRVNIYAEEMTDRIEIITKEIEGQKFTGLRFYLELPVTMGTMQYRGPFKHSPDDDDSSAVTFWGKRDLREQLRIALKLLDEHYDRRESTERDQKHDAWVCKNCHVLNDKVDSCRGCGMIKVQSMGKMT